MTGEGHKAVSSPLLAASYKRLLAVALLAFSPPDSEVVGPAA